MPYWALTCGDVIFLNPLRLWWFIVWINAQWVWFSADFLPFFFFFFCCRLYGTHVLDELEVSFHLLVQLQLTVFWLKQSCCPGVVESPKSESSRRFSLIFVLAWQAKFLSEFSALQPIKSQLELILFNCVIELVTKLCHLHKPAYDFTRLIQVTFGLYKPKGAQSGRQWLLDSVWIENSNFLSQ